MRPFHRRSSLSLSAIFAALTTIALISQVSPAMTAETAAKALPKQATKTNVTPETSSHDIKEWSKNRSAHSRAWNRAASRLEPVRETPAADSVRVPKIHHISASGSEDGEVSTATATETGLNEHSTPAESKNSPQTSSMSVKEQLLNALRKQREATTAETLSSIPGSLTIMNSPSAAPAPSPVLAPSAAAEGLSGETSPEVPVTSPSAPASPANAAKSPIGLTRTLEADLQSNDPYLRERAQRYRQLKKQLLQLRTHQAATAGHAAANTGHPGRDSAAEQLPHPSSGMIPPPHAAEHQQLQNQHAPDQPQAGAVASDVPQDKSGHDTTDEAATAPLEQNVPVKSPHASMTNTLVVDGPIDRLGLANNLFATGEYPMALEMYQLTAGTDLTAPQHFWVEYQTANCLRRLGNPAEASNRYRRLADHPEAGWLSQQAHWWVETLERIRVLEKTLADNAFDNHRAAIEEVEKATLHIQNPLAAPTSDQPLSKEPTDDAHAH